MKPTSADEPFGSVNIIRGNPSLSWNMFNGIGCKWFYFHLAPIQLQATKTRNRFQFSSALVTITTPHHIHIKKVILHKKIDHHEPFCNTKGPFIKKMDEIFIFQAEESIRNSKKEAITYWVVWKKGVSVLWWLIFTIILLSVYQFGVARGRGNGNNSAFLQESMLDFVCYI